MRARPVELLLLHEPHEVVHVLDVHVALAVALELVALLGHVDELADEELEDEAAAALVERVADLKSPSNGYR